MLTKTSRGPGNLDANYAGSNMAEVALELAPSETRTISTEQVVRKWREIMPDLPGIKELSFKSDLFSAGDPINVQLSSRYMDDLITAKNELKSELIRFPGVFDVIIISELDGAKSIDSFSIFRAKSIFSPGFATPSPSPPS